MVTTLILRAWSPSPGGTRNKLMVLTLPSAPEGLLNTYSSWKTMVNAGWQTISGSWRQLLKTRVWFPDLGREHTEGACQALLRLPGTPAHRQLGRRGTGRCCYSLVQWVPQATALSSSGCLAIRVISQTRAFLRCRNQHFPKLPAPVSGGWKVPREVPPPRPASVQLHIWNP